ncbi:MAG: DEAD/DEAH box helicase, partial [Clostridia bacterium]|nr:DEAD/DEAH box helicase [Clostridia bacterium]
DGDERIEELYPFMEALRRHRRYFRYRDGTFIDLSGLEEWRELADAVSEAHELTGREDDLGAMRAAYLTALIREKALPVETDEKVNDLADLRFEAPEPPISCLREYQKRGFAWLAALHRMGLGGILADEMGLGKTVQMITAILWGVQEGEERLPSLVVAPTTLTYNWLNEFKKFAPSLKAVVISGTQAARKEQIEKITLLKGPDVVITSYPLIRRDIDLMRGIRFRFAVLDEAQHVKNAQSVGAHAVKMITADTRIAMTGTPMENHAGELWSLFDYALPGYLPQHNDFMRRWGDGQNDEDLRKRLRPFLMRRLKKDVLGELPEKQETVLFAEMSQEQRQIYDAAMLQKRARVQEVLSEKGLGRSRGEVLSAITELREICCHPVLCLPDYQGASGKMEMLMELLPSAIDAGRRILLFSQFTSMLRLIQKRLSQEGFQALYLDGDTPAAERLDLTHRFNAGEGQVFLISLKAGGTGLNLTGADTVIHYDPWWNPTAEDQATGRAHRIGQTRRVEVWKLIVHDSVEEQVLNLNDRKRKMFDSLITPGETMPTRLTEKDILSLFA